MNKKLANYKTTGNISSDTLFHFTNEFSNLELILQNGIKESNIYEKLPAKNIAYFTNTVCFCDIPLSLVKEHINWYGTYGIGLNTKFAQSKGITPVTYIHSKSPCFPKGSSIETMKWYETYPFTNQLKQIRGKQRLLDEKDTPIFKWKTFYNEKEWRYFSKKYKTDLIQYKVELDLETKLNEYKEREPSFLTFEPKDIEYIIIRDSKDIAGLLNILKSSKYFKDFETLLTKVITIKQILKDF